MCHKNKRGVHRYDNGKYQSKVQVGEEKLANLIPIATEEGALN
jgi:hypothetical protein